MREQLTRIVTEIWQRDSKPEASIVKEWKAAPGVSEGLRGERTGKWCAQRAHVSREKWDCREEEGTVLEVAV